MGIKYSTIRKSQAIHEFYVLYSVIHQYANDAMNEYELVEKVAECGKQRNAVG